ncbi:Fic family protein [Bacillus velezensis]|uniref:Fic family protein n=1 Tax=Bacillus velezensis TaxID=492670 RepID=UPI002FFEE831
MPLNFDYPTQLKNKLDGFRPLRPLEVEKVREIERVEEIYSSNALEGNTLTIYETQMILDEGITIAGKSLREHLEVINLNSAIEYVEDLVKGKHSLNERTLKELHYLVYNHLDRNKSYAGEYRNVGVRILGSKHVPPEPYLIQERMNEFFEWNKNNQDALHPIEYAALLHEKFVTIHPFVDGNGRTARLLMNFALTRNGYPPIFIKPDKENRTAYNKALENVNVNGDTEPFIKLVQMRVEEKLEKMVKVLEYANSKDPSEHEKFLKEMEKKHGQKKLNRNKNQELDR